MERGFDCGSSTLSLHLKNVKGEETLTVKSWKMDRRNTMAANGERYHVNRTGTYYKQFFRIKNPVFQGPQAKPFVWLLTCTH